MGRRNSTDSLPKEVRRWPERAPTGNSFTGYAEFESPLKEGKYSITRSSLQRLGYKVKQQLAWVQAAIKTARLLARKAGDDPDNHSAGLITLVQTKMTDILMHLQESREGDDPFARVKLLATASENIATLTRVSINLKRYQTEAKKRVERVAATTEKIAREGRLSAEAIQTLRREVSGVIS